MNDEFEYGTSLFHDCEKYKMYKFADRDEWLNARQQLHGVGGSAAASALGISPWKSNVELWREKTDRSTPPDISKNPAVYYGTYAEEHIRRLYQLKWIDTVEVQYQENTILKSNKYACMLYSPDGLLIDKNTGRRGILEIKTTAIHGKSASEKWNDQIPDYYYTQILHGLNVTGFEFVDLIAELRYSDDYSQLRTYHIDRDDVIDDMRYELNGVQKFWKYVESDTEPAMIMPRI